MALPSLFIPNTALLVLGLGLNCTIGYGTVFYSFSLMSLELETAFSWPAEFIYGIYSLGILLSGIAAPFIGRYLDRWGVRYLMSVGSLLVALSFFGLATMSTKTEFVIYLLLMEVFSVLVLYESAFVALAHAAGQRARLPITQITLIAGFASTIFWPLISWMLSYMDWRSVYWILGVMHVIICLPLHIFLLVKVKKPTIDTQCNTDAQQKNVQNTQDFIERFSLSPIKVEILISIAFGFVAFCFTGLQIHLFGIMQALSVTDKLALLAGVLVGPFQVVSRAADMLLGQKLNPVYLGILSIASMLLGVLLLMSSIISAYTVLIFAVAFGFGQGLTSIVRGAVPLYIFGEHNYGTITGRMNGIRMIMTALAPVSFSLIMGWFGVLQVLTMMLVGMLISAAILYRLRGNETVA